MGTNWSSLEHEHEPDPWWPKPQLANYTTQLSDDKEETAEAFIEGNRGRVKEEELDAFKQELARKRAMRQEALGALKSEMRDLSKKLEEQSELRMKAEEERDQLRHLTSETLLKQLEEEREEKKKLLEERDQLKEEVEEKLGLQRQVQALKDVSQIGKEMLRIRELQVKELKKNLVEINLKSIMAPPEDLRLEYEKQIENIRKLRTLYDERAAATLLKHKQELEREEAKITVLETKLNEMKKETEDFKEAKSELEGKIEKMEKLIEFRDEELVQTKEKLFSYSAQNQSLNSQMVLINNLFSQMLVSPNVDLDRLTRLLKDNHGLITDVTEKGDSNDVAALLVDLAGQVEKEQVTDETTSKHNCNETFTPQSEIASNLSKVWNVMVELLSHHQNASHGELSGGVESCYKCIQTPSGPRSVISVSKTFITLKDLILEKNRLVKEVGRLKTLNNHLEDRLGSQEKRLSVVTTELKKTWGVVNKLKAQHKQLHTHEKILRYELQQKRCMLTELKEELENCRDKWDRARQKNSETEEDWKKLRREFAARKSRQESNSAESGYEEEDIAHSPPNSERIQKRDVYEFTEENNTEPDLSEEEIENSDGNSFDTVIDLLDIANLENQVQDRVEIPFVLSEVSPHSIDVLPSLLPLTNSEFTDGLDQIESEDLAAVLDVQYQNQLIGADYNLSLPSSSSSSPIPTENDDLASSEMDLSEEDLSSLDTNIQSTPILSNNLPSDDSFLFGSNSSKNVSKFLEGLFQEQQNANIPDESQNLTLAVPSTSQLIDDNESTPIVNNEICYEFPVNCSTKLVRNETLHDSTGNPNTETPKHLKDNSFFTDKENPDVLQSSSQVDSDCITLYPKANLQEEILNAREEKLKKLEQNCRALVSKVMSTSFRSEIISNKLDELHLCYASPDEISDNEYELRIQAKKVDSDQPAQKLHAVDINCMNNCEIGENYEINGKIIESTMSSPPNVERNQDKRTPEEILEARSARLKRLEDQCRSLFSKMSATSSRSEQISNKLDELHESYGPTEHVKAKGKHISRRGPISEKQKNSKGLEHSDCSHTIDLSRDDIHKNCPDLVSESKEILNKCCIAGPSDDATYVSAENPKYNRTPEEILQARADRFKRLEDQCKSLVSKMTVTSLRSEIISNKLDELHSCYGSSEDASDNDDQSTILSSASSPRHKRKLSYIAEKDCNLMTVDSEESSTSTKEHNQRIELRQSTESKPEDTELTDRAKLTPEEILQARAQRLNRLEEQCKSLFNKMSATSQRSDVISNRLEELHEQYNHSTVSETSDRTTLPNDVSSDITDHETVTETEETKTNEGGTE